MPFSNLSNISNLMVPPTTTMSAHVEAANPHPMYLLTSSLVDAVSAKITVDCLNDVHVEDVSMLDSTVLFHSAGVWQPLPVATLLSGVRVGYATTVESGVVRLATYNDISVKNSIAAVTPNLLVDYVSEALVPVNSTISSIQYTVDHLSTPYATTDASGVVKLAVYPDIAGNNSSTVITPNLLKEYVTSSVLNFSGNLEIPTVTNATTTENGIVRLATLDDVSNTNLTIEDPIAVTVPILDCVVASASSTLNLAINTTSMILDSAIKNASSSLNASKQNNLTAENAGSGISISSAASGIKIDCTVSYYPGTNIDIDSNNSINCTPPQATTSEAGITKLVDELPCDINDLHVAAVTPNAILNKVDSVISGGMIGGFTTIWREVVPGLIISTRGDGTNTEGCYKFPFFTTGSLCLAMVWGKTDLLWDDNTCMYDLPISDVGKYKLQDVIVPIFNVEAYGGPETYVTKTGHVTSLNANKTSADGVYLLKHGGINYDWPGYVTNQASAKAFVSNNFNNSRLMMSLVYSNGSYAAKPIVRADISGRVQDPIYSQHASAYRQAYELDNITVQYAAAIHQYKQSDASASNIDFNPVTHLRTIINQINTSSRNPNVFIHWWVLGFTPIATSGAVWTANEVQLPSIYTTSTYYDSANIVASRTDGETMYSALYINTTGEQHTWIGNHRTDLINEFNKPYVTSDNETYISMHNGSRNGAYAYAHVECCLSRVLADGPNHIDAYYACSNFFLNATAVTNSGSIGIAVRFTSNTKVDMVTNTISNVRIDKTTNGSMTSSIINIPLEVCTNVNYKAFPAARYDGEYTDGLAFGAALNGGQVRFFASLIGYGIIIRAYGFAFNNSNYARVTISHCKVASTVNNNSNINVLSAVNKLTYTQKHLVQ